MAGKLGLFVCCLFLLIMGGVSSAAAAPPNVGSQIIVFKDQVDVERAVPEMARAYGLQVGFTYNYALKGMSAVVPAARLKALRNDPRVAYVEADQVQTISVQTVPTGVQRIFADGSGTIGIDGSDDWRVDVDVAVIDTGVDFQHPDLNVAGGVDCTVYSGGGPPWSRNYYCSSTQGTGGDDNHYHGTHVAGSIAALDNNEGVVGVAPGARIWAVKVLDQNGSGYTSGIVAGIDWIVDQGNIEVANMSLGGSGFSQAEYDAIQGAVEAGVAFAVAAGNSNANASNYSPAAFDNALTVSALADFDGQPGGNGSATCRTDQDDTLADFSNWGSAVQIAAPGVCILSTYPLEQGGYGTTSGTSMASPHAAGALALLASSNNPNDEADVYGLYDQVIAEGNFDWTDDSGDGILEPLLDVSNTGVFAPTLVAGGGSGGGGGDNAPTVTINSPADGLSFETGVSIDFAGSATDDEDGNLTNALEWTSDLDGQIIGTGGSFSAALSSLGTHTITAAVTDNGNNTTEESITVTIVDNSGGGGDFFLEVNAYKDRGVQFADLSWSGTSASNFDVKRDGVIVATTSNEGAYTDSTGQKGGGSASYQVCEAGTEICSNIVNVIW